MKNRVQWVMVALAAAGLAGGVVMAQTSTEGSTSGSGTSTTPGAHHWHRRPGMMGMGLMRALRQLNLTSAQQQQIHTIMTNARQQFATQQGSTTRPDFVALSNPADPNHAAAISQLESNMNARLEQQDSIQKQIYAVLTPEQQSQLPAVLANIKARMAAHASGTQSG
jgi:Spy/CpxP family protein refolding chaperone